MAERWSTEENLLLVELRQQGVSWSDIAEALPLRSRRACRSHYDKIVRLRQMTGTWKEDS